jgi:N-sulfoglucosamine sulfohydrolase
MFRPMIAAWFLVLSLFCGIVAAAPRNIVLFVTDDQSPDAGCYGDKVLKTPHLDALAAEGVRFDRAFCTTASCSASRSVILTGLYNHANAQYGHEHAYHHFRTYDQVVSLPVRLSRAGYRTGRIGKLHVGPEEVYQFETNLPGNARSPVEMAEKCRQFISAKADRPFFLYFCTADPHRSGGSVPDVEHNPNPFGNQPRGYPQVTEVAYAPGDVTVPMFLPNTPVCRAELAQYYQSISRIDQGLGRLVQILREAGQYDDTLIIYTSDHGMAFPGAKTTLYEGGMRVPLVVRKPGGPDNHVTQAMVSLAPTILEFAGAAPDRPAALHGRSFLSAMEQADPREFREVFASHTFHEITMYYPMRVVRTDRYKLIWNIAHGLPFPFASDLWTAPTWQDVYQQGPDALYGRRTVQNYIHRPVFELYDLRADPSEVQNLADDAEQAGLLAELQGKLKEFQKRTDDPWILKWDYE